MTEPAAIIDTRQTARQILPILELCLFDRKVSATQVREWTDTVSTRFGPIAALQVQPSVVGTARAICDDLDVPVAVTLSERFDEALPRAVEDGAQEIGVVFPYEKWMLGDLEAPKESLANLRGSVGGARLTYVMETPVLNRILYVVEATKDALRANADWIQLSVPDPKGGASSPEEINAVTEAVAAHNAGRKDARTGVKAGGLVGTLAEAQDALYLAKSILGPTGVNKDTFRIVGSLALYGEVIKVLESDA